MTLLFAALAQLLFTCGSPFKWNADIKEFLDDGRSIEMVCTVRCVDESLFDSTPPSPR